MGWIVLAIFLLFLYSCTRTAMRVADVTAPASGARFDSASRQATDYRAKVVDSGCQDSAGGGYTIIRATLENTGTATIPFAKAFFEAYDAAGKLLEAKDTYFSPTDIPPGARASADVMLRGDVARCGLIRVQGSGGEPVTLSWN